MIQVISSRISGADSQMSRLSKCLLHQLMQTRSRKEWGFRHDPGLIAKGLVITSAFLWHVPVLKSSYVLMTAIRITYTLYLCCTQLSEVSSKYPEERLALTTEVQKDYWEKERKKELRRKQVYKGHTVTFAIVFKKLIFMQEKNKSADIYFSVFNKNFDFYLKLISLLFDYMEL